MSKTVDRFWAKVRKTDECWFWMGACYPCGYGEFHLPTKETVAAHRVAYQLLVGPIPVGMVLCHHCDERRCVRPDHLFVGTQRDNMRDMATKGRQGFQVDPTRAAHGEMNGKAVLTDEIVRSIRKKYATGKTSYPKLAKEFDICKSHVEQVVRRKIWKHVS
jgi:hypothetical protein